MFFLRSLVVVFTTKSDPDSKPVLPSTHPLPATQTLELVRINILISRKLVSTDN